MSFQENQNQIAFPHNYMCPITHDLMENPVIAADGRSYERAAIEAWLNSGRNTSPYTGALLRDRNLTPNHSLRTIIIEFKEFFPTLERQQQIATDFEEACRLREKEINEARVKPTENEKELRQLLENEKAKNATLHQQLKEMQKKLSQERMQPAEPGMPNNDLPSLAEPNMANNDPLPLAEPHMTDNNLPLPTEPHMTYNDLPSPVKPNMPNNDLLSITPESRRHFLRKTGILLTPSQSTEDSINLNDIVQSGSLIRGDNDAWAITRWFSGHYYLFYQTEHYYLTLELRKSLCKKHNKKEHRYIFTNDFILACNDCRKENPNERLEKFDRKSLVDFSIQRKPTIILPKDERERRLHLFRQEIIKSKSRAYPCVVESWSARNSLTLKDLLKRAKELARLKYGFLSFNCRDFAQDLQEFTKSK